MAEFDQFVIALCYSWWVSVAFETKHTHDISILTTTT